MTQERRVGRDPLTAWPSLIGRYGIVGHIGRGGMAEVLRGRLSGLGGFERDVAIKVLLPEYAEEPDFVDMLLDEARIAGAIVHPCVVQMYDVGRQDDLFYLVMEYIDGADLRTRMKLTVDGILPLEPTLYVMSEVLRGLEAVHASVDRDGRPRRIVHRDVSPANVLIDGRGCVRIGDFGIAHASSRLTRTRQGAVKGKLRYMAPEQMAALPIDHRADLYAVGVMMVELLLGPGYLEEVATARGAGARGLGPAFAWTGSQGRRGPAARLAADVARILDRALAAAPDERFADARAFRRELLQALHQRRPGFGPDELKAVFDRIEQDARARSAGRGETRTEIVESTAQGQDDDSNVSLSMLSVVHGGQQEWPPESTDEEEGRSAWPEAPPTVLSKPSARQEAGRGSPSGRNRTVDPSPPASTSTPAAPSAGSSSSGARPPALRATPPVSTGLTNVSVRSPGLIESVGRELGRLGFAGQWTLAIVAGAAALGLITVLLVWRTQGPEVEVDPHASPQVRSIQAPPVVAAPVAQAVKPGTLVVGGRPGSKVTIGSDEHVAPCRIDLAPGDYLVRIARPGRSVPLERTVTIRAGQATEVE